MVKLNARIARGNSYSNEKAPRLYPVITDKKRFKEIVFEIKREEF